MSKKQLQQYLEIAQIVNTHGVRGDLKLIYWCDSCDTIKKLKTLYFDPNGCKPIQISNVRPYGKFVLLRASGINTPEEGAKYKEQILYANRDDIKLNDGDFFIVDLIGTPVIDAEDPTLIYGTLSNVIDNPANSLYEIKTKSGSVLIPAVNEFIIRLDPPNGIYIRPIDRKSVV